MFIGNPFQICLPNQFRRLVRLQGFFYEQLFQTRVVSVNATVGFRQLGRNAAHDLLGVGGKLFITVFTLQRGQCEHRTDMSHEIEASEVLEAVDHLFISTAGYTNGEDWQARFGGNVAGTIPTLD
jgi:hypothetical protein